MARKLNKNLLALSSAAIVSIYAVGFVRSATTPASAGSVSTTTPAVVASMTRTPSADAATAIARALASASATPAATQTTTSTQTASVSTVAAAASATPAATARYQDGTYTGSGTSRMGNISVAVAMQDGQITAVRITGSTTHYPASRISRLPGEAVAAQSTNIKLVSGATYSSQAFQQAVTQALAQAETSA